MVSCLKWWQVRWQSILMCLVRSWKTELWAIWIELWLSQYIGVWWEKKTLISASNQRNQTISLVVDVMAEAEGKSKYQILQKRKTKYHSKKKLQKLNANTNCRNWKKRQNTKTITETEHKYQIAEAEGKSKYQILQKRKTKYHSKKIIETECKYLIAETEEKTKHQNNYRDRTEIPNCRSWRKVEIPNFAEAEDKISLKKLQKLNANIKLQKLKRRRYQNNCRNRTEIPNCRNWRKVKIPDFAKAEDKISLQNKL